MLSFIQYLTEAKTRPDAMQRFEDRALAGAQERVKQQDELLSPLASLNTHWAPDHGTKYWYHPDSKQLVPVWDGDDEGVHADTVIKNPGLFGITDETADKMRNFKWGRDDARKSELNPVHAAIRNGWVRLETADLRGLTVQGTQAQAHKVVRDHYAATAGARPSYCVDHFIEGKVHGGWLQGAEHVQHYIDHSGTPPMSARWYQADFDSTND